LDFYSDKQHEELIKLKEKYKNQIKILIGAEFDWIETRKEWVEKETKRRHYDIKIVSVHLIYLNRVYYTLNSRDANFGETLKLSGNDIKKFVKMYYKNVRDAANSGLFDVLGHFDLIKIFNKDSRYFSQEDSWYKKEVIKTLKVVKKSGLKLDLNLSGFRYPCGEQFPSKWIIDDAQRMGIKFLIGTDAHREEALDYDLDDVRRMLYN